MLASADAGQLLQPQSVCPWCSPLPQTSPSLQVELARLEGEQAQLRQQLQQNQSQGGTALQVGLAFNSSGCPAIHVCLFQEVCAMTNGPGSVHRFPLQEARAQVAELQRQLDDERCGNLATSTTSELMRTVRHLVVAWLEPPMALPAGFLTTQSLTLANNHACRRCHTI